MCVRIEKNHQILYFIIDNYLRLNLIFRRFVDATLTFS